MGWRKLGIGKGEVKHRGRNEVEKRTTLCQASMLRDTSLIPEDSSMTLPRDTRMQKESTWFHKGYLHKSSLVLIKCGQVLAPNIWVIVMDTLLVQISFFLFQGPWFPPCGWPGWFCSIIILISGFILLWARMRQGPGAIPILSPL